MTQSELENTPTSPAPILEKHETEPISRRCLFFSKWAKKYTSARSWIKEKDEKLEAFLSSEKFEKFIKLTFDHFKNSVTSAGFVVVGMWFRSELIRISYSKGFLYWLFSGIAVIVSVVGGVLFMMNLLHGLVKIRRNFSKPLLSLFVALYGVILGVMLIYLVFHK